MISFIVIGKNEAKTLPSCFKSIFETININNIKDYEIIYVDSHSKDSSIDIAKTFENITIFQITKNVSAAAGRNTGAKNAKGNILFFIDADMIVIPKFLDHVLVDKYEQKYDLVTGEFVYHILNNKGVEIEKIPYYITKKEKQNVLVSNGCFIIKKSIWDELGGMDVKMKCWEDFDFFARCRKKGYPLVRVKKTLAHHYLISYENPIRFWNDLFLGRQLQERAFLWRKNMFNRYIYSLFLRMEYSFLLLLLSALLSIIISPYCLFLYSVIIIPRAISQSKKKLLKLHHYILYLIARDIGVFIALFIYYPKKKNPIYKIIQP